MHLGQLKAIYRQLNAATTPAEVLRLENAETAWMWELAAWTPATPREIVQACAIARYMLDNVQVPESEALGELRSCPYGIVRCVRSGYAGTARSMRLLPQAGTRAGLQPEHDGPECDALAAIARAARPAGGRARPGRDVRALARRAL